MGLQFLKDALEDIKALIAITEQDIIDIKAANNDSIFERIPQKEALISSFIKKKESYAKSIEDKLKQYYPNADISDLSHEDKKKLLGDGAAEVTEQLHDSLELLKAINTRFGKMSCGVFEFYHSLLKNIVPIEEGGYNKNNLGNSAFLKAEV